MPSLFHERALFRRHGVSALAGVDEAGRGALAGPVVAAAVVLDFGSIPKGIDDSKKLTPSARARLNEEICRSALTSLGIVDAETIDEINILRASLEAMRLAVLGLETLPQAALIDGRDAPALPCLCETLTGGDGLSLSVAAASIVAKVARDRLMERFAERYPSYGFARHKGYGTKAHREAIARFGASPIHRKSFAPLRHHL